MQRVDVIVGPGNLYVQEAKQQLSRVVGIDSFAGPSDLLVLVRRGRRPRSLALDLLAQAEHGAGSLVAAVSQLAQQALDRLAQSIERLERPRPDLAPGGVRAGEVADAARRIELANAFAPEHLQLVGAAEEELAPHGPIRGLPVRGRRRARQRSVTTSRAPTTSCRQAERARFSSGLSPRQFRRRMPEVRIGDQAAEKLARAGAPIAEPRASRCTPSRCGRVIGARMS